MKLSLALGTFNGTRYLTELLESIRGQTRRPDEIVICDDASTDGTLAMLKRFARDAPSPVRIESNASTLGSTRNFCRAISRCTGEIVVLADQDDVWLPTKLAQIESTFRDHPEAGFCFSDAEVVDCEMRPLGYRLWDALRFQPQERAAFREGRAFESLLRRHRVTGATMAFLTRHRELVLPIPSGWVHDAWIALTISAIAPCELIDETLIHYRQHDGQQHGGKKRSLVAEYRAARKLTRERCDAVADRFAEAFERLRTVSAVPPERLELLRLKIEHHRRRAEMRTDGTRRLPIVLKEAYRGNYRRYGQGWKAIAQDLLMR